MLGLLRYYVEPIAWACLLFPIIAGVFTLPFAVANYRKFGGIAVMRVMVVSAVTPAVILSMLYPLRENRPAIRLRTPELLSTRI